jgi:hypothetical protein
MSVTTEITPIEGIDLEGTPPCQVTHNLEPCGNASAFRVVTRCLSCGLATIFICTRCLNLVRVGGGRCTGCWTGQRTIDRFT